MTKYLIENILRTLRDDDYNATVSAVRECFSIDNLFDTRVRWLALNPRLLSCFVDQFTAVAHRGQHGRIHQADYLAVE